MAYQEDPKSKITKNIFKNSFVHAASKLIKMESFCLLSLTKCTHFFSIFSIFSYGIKSDPVQI